jgi:integrase
MFYNLADAISMATPYFDNANKTWKIKIKEDGKWSGKTLCKGEYAVDPPDEVLRLAAAFVPAEAVETAGDGLRAYCDLYLARHHSKKANGIRRRQSVLRRFCDYAEGQGWATMSSIGVRQINAWVDHRREVEKASDGTIVSDLANLQGIFRAAMEEERLSINPVTTPARQARKRADAGKNDENGDLEEIKFYTREQEQRIFDVLPQAHSQYQDLVVILHATGMRADAAIHMEAGWVRDDYMIRIPRKWDKGGKGYATYAFGEKAKKVIDRRRREHPEGSIFPEIGSTGTSWHYFDPFYHRHGLTDIVEIGAYNHAWRHTFAVRRVEDCMPIHVLQKFMGHHDIRITQRYAKVSDHAMREAIAEVEGRYAVLNEVRRP